MISAQLARQPEDLSIVTGQEPDNIRCGEWAPWEGTAMTGAPIVDDDSKLITEPPANLDEWIGRLMSEQIGPSVYATHCQMRAGFFNRTFKLPRTYVSATTGEILYRK
jgi:hypothetical protein